MNGILFGFWFIKIYWDWDFSFRYNIQNKVIVIIAYLLRVHFIRRSNNIVRSRIIHGLTLNIDSLILDFIANQNAAMAVSYKRRRDYSKQLNWTYEPKQDLYGCYKKANEDLKLGYMKRMKEYWDEIHPEIAFLPKEIQESKQLGLNLTTTR